MGISKILHILVSGVHTYTHTHLSPLSCTCTIFIQAMFIQYAPDEAFHNFGLLTKDEGARSLGVAARYPRTLQLAGPA